MVVYYNVNGRPTKGLFIVRLSRNTPTHMQTAIPLKRGVLQRFCVHASESNTQFDEYWGCCNLNWLLYKWLGCLAVSLFLSPKIERNSNVNIYIEIVYVGWHALLWVLTSKPTQQFKRPHCIRKLPADEGDDCDVLTFCNFRHL